MTIKANMSVEINFDGIVGPTHNYSGLAYGNVASLQNKLAESNPRAAALQGLEKMWYLASLGFPQGIIPPQERPHLPTLKHLGFRGTDAEILHKVMQTSPDLLYAVSSASSMWTANAATVAPSADASDERVHFTAANLEAKFHRSIEVPMTAKILKTIFENPQFFNHHAPLPSHLNFNDEGAANHTRFCGRHSGVGVHFFVFGRHAFHPNIYLPKVFPARQTSEASQAIARLHKLKNEATIFAQQNPKAVDAGVFHNDVIAVGNRNVLLYHELAFIESEAVIAEIQAKVMDICDSHMIFIKVKESQISLKDAIAAYLFNSQLMTLPDGSMALFAPIECRTTPSVYHFLEEMAKDSSNPISQVHYVDTQESMRNGGGPACLRLRVVLNEKELAAINPNFILTENLYNQLKSWIESHYRDKLHPRDLSDPNLLTESRKALTVLTEILNVRELYEFQWN